MSRLDQNPPYITEGMTRHLHSALKMEGTIILLLGAVLTHPYREVHGMLADLPHNRNVTITEHQNNNVLLRDNVVFYYQGSTFPQEITLPVTTEIDMGTLLKAPNTLRDTSRRLHAMALEWGTSPVAQPVPPDVDLPGEKYLALKGKLTRRQAMLQCENLQMRLASPRNVSEWTELQSWTLTNGPWAPGAKPFLWIGASFDLVNQEWVNPISRQALHTIYHGLPGSNLQYVADDFSSAPTMDLVTGNVLVKRTEGLGLIMNSYSRDYAKRALSFNAVCQRYDTQDSLAQLKKRIREVQDQYWKGSQELPEEAIMRTQRFIWDLATEESRLFDEIMERHGLHLAYIPGPPRRRTTPRPVPRLSEAMTQYVNTTNDIPSDHRRSKRDADFVPQYLLNLSKQLPVIGPGIATVEDMIREKKRAQFEDTTKEQLYQMSLTSVENSRRVAGLEFQTELGKDRLENLEKMVGSLLESIKSTTITLDLNGQLDAIRADSLALHTDYLRTLHKFEDWLACLDQGITPPEMLTSKLMASVKSMIQEMGWNVKVKFQDATSTILPAMLSTSTLTVLSNIRVTGPPWDLYMLQTLPIWTDNKLYREDLKHPFIAVDNYFSKYLTMDKEEYRACRNKPCELRGAIRALSNAECGVKALLGKTNSDDCPVHEITPPADFFETSPHGVIYAVQESQTVTITCPHSGEKPQLVTIVGSGLLTIPDGCQVVTQQGVIYHGPPYWGLPARNLRRAENIVVSILDMNAWVNRLHHFVDNAVGAYDVIQQGPYYITITLVSTGSIVGSLALCCMGWRVYLCFRPRNTLNLRRHIQQEEGGDRPAQREADPQPNSHRNEPRNAFVNNQRTAETLRWYRRLINNTCRSNTPQEAPQEQPPAPRHIPRGASSLSALAERDRRLRAQPIRDTPDPPIIRRDSLNATAGSRLTGVSPNIQEQSSFGTPPNATPSPEEGSLNQRHWDRH